MVWLGLGKQSKDQYVPSFLYRLYVHFCADFGNTVQIFRIEELGQGDRGYLQKRIVGIVIEIVVVNVSGVNGSSAFELLYFFSYFPSLPSLANMNISVSLFPKYL